jgi:uncharacterized protein YjdB
MRLGQLLNRAACILLLWSPLAVVSCGQKPASIEVQPNRLTIYGLNKTSSVTAKVLDRKGQPMQEPPVVAWSSSNGAVAQVGTDGVVTAKSEGHAILKATAGSLSAEVPVQVHDLGRFDISPPSVHLVGPPGTMFRLTAVELDSKGRPVRLTPAWKSTHPDVATVDSGGALRSVSNGKSTVSIHLGDREALAEVTVDVKAIDHLVVHPDTSLLHPNDSQHLSVGAVGGDGKPIPDVTASFSSSNEDVATVDAGGVVQARRRGTAIITATVGNQSATATIIVD